MWPDLLGDDYRISEPFAAFYALSEAFRQLPLPPLEIRQQQTARCWQAPWTANDSGSGVAVLAFTFSRQVVDDVDFFDHRIRRWRFASQAVRIFLVVVEPENFRAAFLAMADFWFFAVGRNFLRLDFGFWIFDVRFFLRAGFWFKFFLERRQKPVFLSDRVHFGLKLTTYSAVRYRRATFCHFPYTAFYTL